MKLKVYSGQAFINGKQYRATIAAKSQKEVARIADVSLYYVRCMWCETGNSEAVVAGLANPETLLIQREPYKSAWIPASELAS